MPFKILHTLKEDFELACGYDAAFDFLIDVPKTARYFPRVERLVDLGDGCFQWEMEEVGVSRYSAQLIYACKYEYNKEEGWIKWAPVPGIGNGVNSGSATLEPKGDGTHVHFSTDLEIEAPLPKLAKRIVTPFVKREFDKTMRQFRDKVQAAAIKGDI